VNSHVSVVHQGGRGREGTLPTTLVAVGLQPTHQGPVYRPSCHCTKSDIPLTIGELFSEPLLHGSVQPAERLNGLMSPAAAAASYVLYGTGDMGPVLTTRNYTCLYLFIFRVRRSRGEMYIGHGRLCACLSVCLSVCPSPHSHTAARTRM